MFPSSQIQNWMSPCRFLPFLGACAALLSMWGACAEPTARPPVLGARRPRPKPIGKPLEVPPPRAPAFVSEGELRLTQQDFPPAEDWPASVEVGGTASVRLSGIHAPGWTLRIREAGSIVLERCEFGAVLLEGSGSLVADGSRLGEVRIRPAGRARLSGCQVQECSLWIGGVERRLEGWKPGAPPTRAFELKYRIVFERTLVNRWAFRIGRGTRATFVGCEGIRIYLELETDPKESIPDVATYDGLAPGAFRQHRVSSNGAAVQIDLENTSVDGWGLESRGRATLSARASRVSGIAAEGESRVIMMEGSEAGGTIVATDRASVELEDSTLGRCDLYALDSSKVLFDHCRTESGARVHAAESAIVEFKDTLPPPTLDRRPSARIIVDGREWTAPKGGE